jgi:hypothetical protein
MTHASVIVPTFDHASTLEMAVDSALAQTFGDLEVLIVGDGVTPEVRAVAQRLVEKDARVRFLDFPKGAHHGETHRHTAITQSTGAIIVYLCDDDLLLPEHVGDLAHLLHTHDFVQSLNGHIGIDGVVGLYPGDLADPAFVSRLTDAGRRYNFVSLTGTAHTREFYDRAATPWETTPDGEWPDRHQWRRMLLAVPGARGATSPRMTAISLPTHHSRQAWTPEQRAVELGRWAELIRRPDAQQEIDRRVGAAAVRQLVATERAWLEALDAGDRRVATMTSSRWWRLGRRLRPGLRGRES